MWFPAERTLELLAGGAASREVGSVIFGSIGTGDETNRTRVHGCRFGWWDR